MNTVNNEIANRSIDDQLKMIREEKYQEYLLNTGCKSPTITKTRNSSVIYKPEKKTQPFNGQCSHHIETIQLICRANQLTSFYMMGTLAVKKLNETAEINKEFHWPSVACAIVGDSMVNGIDQKEISETWQC